VVIQIGGSVSPLKLGVMVSLTDSPEESLRRVKSLGFPTCQVSIADPASLDEKMAARLRQAVDQLEIEVTTIWTHCRRGQVWDFLAGPATIGLVPPETRPEALKRLMHGSDFARWVGVPSITTHVGFIPENPGDAQYSPLIAALQEIAVYCQSHDQQFWFETGQETPTTLLRTIEDVGTDNLGVNLDPANLLMYGKANPVDALDVIGRYVRGVHAKDGEYPTNGRALGLEKALGEGRVNFPVLIPRLKSLGYTGAITIEREVRGAAQIAGFEQARRVLEPLL
jgi:L-ribulose-5-phosphate 3-epimerase